jgi:ferric-dicitrate binding protein FerR (iron transport regulator)
MYLTSRYAGWGRGFWINIDHGDVDVHTKKEDVHIKVQHGRVAEQTTRIKDDCTTLKYGQELTIKNAER